MYIPTMRILRYLLRKMRVFIFKWRIGAYHFVHFNKFIKAYIFILLQRISHICRNVCMAIWSPKEWPILVNKLFSLSSQTPAAYFFLSFWHYELYFTLNSYCPVWFYHRMPKGTGKMGDGERTFFLFICFPFLNFSCDIPLSRQWTIFLVTLVSRLQLLLVLLD